MPSSLASSLQRLGVPVFKGDATVAVCRRERFPFLAGYNRRYNSMIVCLNNAKTSQIPELIAHESIHLAQDCSTGLSNDSVRTIDTDPAKAFRMLDPSERELIVHAYDPDQWFLEGEAFLAQRYPDLVSDVVDARCPLNR